jgi:capsular polysaccharide biosynthesis protein
MFLNLKIGTMLGLFMGVGIVLADYLIDTVYKAKDVAS